MKKLITGFAFLLSVVAVNAQDAVTPITAEQAITQSSSDITNKSIDQDKVCYSEVSKIAFYEALISHNELNIHLKDSDRVAIKNTEEIISNSGKQTLYTDNN